MENCQHLKKIKNNQNMIVCKKCGIVIDEINLENLINNSEFYISINIRENKTIKNIEKQTFFNDALRHRILRYYEFVNNVESILSLFQIINIKNKIEQCIHHIFNSEYYLINNIKNCIVIQKQRYFIKYNEKMIAFSFLVLELCNENITFENFSNILKLSNESKKNILLCYTNMYLQYN